MTPEQKQKQKSKHATNEQTRWTKRRKNMTPEEIKNEKSQRATKSKEKKLRIEKQKENNPKGFVSNDADLLSKKFVIQETRSNVVSDEKYRDEKVCQYLGKMSVVCGYCSGIGFASEGLVFSRLAACSVIMSSCSKIKLSPEIMSRPVHSSTADKVDQRGFEFRCARAVCSCSAVILPPSGKIVTRLECTSRLALSATGFPFLLA